MPKKIVALLLAAAMLISLSGCADGGQTVVVQTPSDTSTATAEALMDDTATETTEAITDTTSDASSEEKTDEAATDETSDDETTDNATEVQTTDAEKSDTEEETPVLTTVMTTVQTTVQTTEKTTAATAPPVVRTTAAVTTTKPVTATPSPATVLTPVASGTKTESTTLGVIDYSNTADGYIMVKYTGTVKKVKVQIKGPNDVTQTYNLNSSGNYETFPLPAGNGTYSVTLAENISGNSYAIAATASVKVSLSSETAPFLRPNQYANYTTKTTAVKKASELCAGTTNALQKVDKVYSWLVDNVVYDTDLANTITSTKLSGYLPDTDKVINNKKGICLDYAGAAVTMLRSQGVPTKLVVGYAGKAYHAWISVYVKDVGWVYGAIYFDGSAWHRMDPTFGASSHMSDKILQYIGNGSNYSEKYIY